MDDHPELAALRTRLAEEERAYASLLAALDALAADGEVDPALCARAIERYRIDADAPAPWSI